MLTRTRTRIYYGDDRDTQAQAIGFDSDMIDSDDTQASMGQPDAAA